MKKTLKLDMLWLKRMIVMALVLFALPCLAHSENNAFGIDWTQYSEAEIKWIIANMYDSINQGLAELDKRQSDGARTYHILNIDFDIAFYAFNDNSILIEYDWINTSSKATSFNWNISAQAYQNGKELSDWILHFGNIKKNDSESILPGFGKKSYHYFRLEDDSTVTIVINDYLHPGDMDRGLVFNIRPEDLKPFEE